MAETELDDREGGDSLLTAPLIATKNSGNETSEFEFPIESDGFVRLPLQNEFQTIINTFNLYVGCGILSIGYGIKLTGWIGLPVLAVCTFLMSLSAKYICYSFDFFQNNEIVQSYPNLGYLAFGNLGSYAVLISVILEFWGALGVVLIIVWQSLDSLIPPLLIFGIQFSSTSATILFSALFVFPSVWIRSFSRMSFLSVVGKLGTLLILLVVILAYVIDPDSSSVEGDHSHKYCDASYIPMTAGIFLVSLSGHAGLPSLRRNMKNKKNFNFCINVTFSLMFILYAIMGSVSYLYFGNTLEVLVTTNLNSSSSVNDIYLIRCSYFSFTVTQFLLVLVAMSVFTTIAPLVYVLTELLLDLCGTKLNGTDTEKLLPFVRTFVVVIGYITAIIGYNVLENVESIVGGFCSVLVSLLLPTLIYFSLSYTKLNSLQKVWMIAMIAFSFVCVIAIPAMNVYEILNP